MRKEITGVFIIAVLLLAFGGVWVEAATGEGMGGAYGMYSFGPGERHNILNVTVRKQDGSTVIPGETDIIELNCDVEFNLSPQCAFFEYCISKDEGKSYSRYRSLRGNCLRLKAGENRQAEGIWYLRFRGLGKKLGIVSESVIYRIRFDLTCPEIETRIKERNGEEELFVSVRDTVSGIKSVEVGNGGELLYRETVYRGEGRETEKSFSFPLPLRTRAACGSLTVTAYDFAGNREKITETYGEESFRTYVTDREKDRFPSDFFRPAKNADLKTTGNTDILPGLILAAILAGEAVAVLPGVLSGTDVGRIIRDLRRRKPV